MITFHTYRDILAGLRKCNVQSRSICSLLTCGASIGDLFLKHDVEANIGRAVRLAEIEHETGHSATYYFQGDLVTTAAGGAAVQTIGRLGHEIAYHYDVLDANDGDFAVAGKEFREYLAAFEALGFQVRTVCPHGNPTKIRRGWRSNKDFFRSADVRSEFPAICDIVVRFRDLLPAGAYVSDAGFALRQILNIDGNDDSNDGAMNDGRTVDWSDLLGIIRSDAGLVLSVHPHRFESTEFSRAARKAVFNTAKYGYLAARRLPIVSALANSLYKHARKF
jgi:hypothetical protein